MNVQDSTKTISIIYAVIISFCLFPVNSVPLIYLIFENLLSAGYEVGKLWMCEDALMAGFVLFNSIYALSFLLKIFPSSFIAWFCAVKEVDNLKITKEKGKLLKNIPAVSVIIPAYNEEKTVIQTVYACQKQTWKPSQIIIIDDGSKDNTSQLLISEFNLKRTTIPVKKYALPQNGEIKSIYFNNNITLITKENAGKSYALNLATEFVTSDITCLFDGDTMAEPEGIMGLAYPMIENKNIVLTSGRNQLINECVIDNGEIKQVRISSNPLVSVQVREFLTDLPEKAFENYLNSQMTLVGNFSCYRTNFIYRLNGFAGRGLTEDYDYNFDIHTLKNNGEKVEIKSIITTVGWTQAPFTISGLYRQRLRWATGKLDSTIRHSRALFNRKLGFAGMLIVPLRWLHTIAFPVDFVAHFINIPLAIYLYYTSPHSHLIEQIFWLYYVPMFVYQIIYEFIFHNYYDWKYIRSYDKITTYLSLTAKRFIYNYFYISIIFCAEIMSYWKVFVKSSEWGKSDRATITPL